MNRCSRSTRSTCRRRAAQAKKSGFSIADRQPGPDEMEIRAKRKAMGIRPL